MTGKKDKEKAAEFDDLMKMLESMTGGSKQDKAIGQLVMGALMKKMLQMASKDPNIFEKMKKPEFNEGFKAGFEMGGSIVVDAFTAAEELTGE